MTQHDLLPFHLRSGKAHTLVTAGFCLSPGKQGLSLPMANTAPVFTSASRPVADNPASSAFLSETEKYPIQNP